MLRTLGASRRQILSSVMVEALAIGLIGAIVGVGGGFVIALAAASAASKRFGIDLPTTSLVMESRTVVVSLLVGVVVTLVSSLIPALRSTRVPPIAALHAFIAGAEPAPPARLPSPSRSCSAWSAWRCVARRPLRRRRRRCRGRADGRRRR